MSREFFDALDKTRWEYHECATCGDICCQYNADPAKCPMCRDCRKGRMAGRTYGENGVDATLRRLK